MSIDVHHVFITFLYCSCNSFSFARVCDFPLVGVCMIDVKHANPHVLDNFISQCFLGNKNENSSA